MSTSVENLARRVAALEKRLSSEELIDEEDKGEDCKEASERKALLAQINSLERRVKAADGDEIPPEVTMEDVVTAEDEEDDVVTAEDEEDDVVTAADEEDDEKTASLIDPDGIEEQITQDRFTEVEDLRHGVELTTGDSMLDVAPTEYVARLKRASVRLDAVADYLEKTGRNAMAMRIDKIADTIDARLAKITTKS